MSPTDWGTLLQHLGSAPRENGSQGLQTAASYLAESLRAHGWQVENLPFTAYPYEQRVLGVLLLLGAAAYWWCMRARRFGIAALIAIALPLLVWAHFDHGLRVSLGVGSLAEYNVAARLPVGAAQRHLLFSAHYDTKTDLLDHILRAPVQMFGIPAGILMIVIALSSFVAFQAERFTPNRRRAATVMAWVALLYGIASAAVFTGGVFLEARSNGAVDDGAACAVLLRLGEELAATPPQHTQVELVFFAAEELSVQGSSAFAAQRFADDKSIKPLVVNLDPIGASSELAVVGRESTFLKSHEPAPEVVALLDRVHRAMTTQPIEVTPLGGLTDGFSFLTHAVPAATILNAVPPFILPRKLHSANDTVDRIAPGSLDHALEFLTRVVRTVDAAPDQPQP